MTAAVKRKLSIGVREVPLLGAYKPMYLAEQRRLQALHGSMGPLDIFAKANRPLLVAYLGGKHATLHLPERWTQDKKARVLYDLGARAADQLRAASVRCCALSLWLTLRFVVCGSPMEEGPCVEKVKE